MSFWTSHSLCKDPSLIKSNYVPILSMYLCNTSKIFYMFECFHELTVVRHQCIFVCHKHLEGVNSVLFCQFLHFLLCFNSHSKVTTRLFLSSFLPLSKSIHQTSSFLRNDQIHHHSCSTSQSCSGARFKVILKCHCLVHPLIEMSVCIYSTREYKLIHSIDHSSTFWYLYI